MHPIDDNCVGPGPFVRHLDLVFLTDSVFTGEPIPLPRSSNVISYGSTR